MTVAEERLTVAVCTRDRPSAAAAAIRSILADRSATPAILVVDQSTTDETQQAVEAIPADGRVRHVRVDSVGIGASRRAAVELATTEYIAFTDDDCAVPAGWSKSLLAELDRRPDISMLFCTVQAAAHDERAGFVPTYQCSASRTVETMRDKCTARGIGAGMALRRTAALAVGSFDPALGSRFVGACEEGDLAVRLLLAGHRVGETDDTYVVHDGFRTWEQGRELARRNFRGIGLAYSKPIRCGRLRALVVVAYEGLVVPLLEPLWRRRRPSVRAFVGFWLGFWQGLFARVDRRTLLFVGDDAAG